MSITLNGTTGITSPALDLTIPLAIADGGTGTSIIPAFSAYQSVAQSISSATLTKVLFQSEEFDTNNNYDASTSRFTPTIAGYYHINATVSGNGTGAIYTSIAKNGVEFKRGTQVPNPVSVVVDSLIYLNGTTDYVEIYAFYGTGNTTNAQAYLTYFQGFLVRAA